MWVHGSFQGVHVTALREIKVLKELKHEHVLELMDIFHHKRNLNLVSAEIQK